MLGKWSEWCMPLHIQGAALSSEPYLLYLRSHKLLVRPTSAAVLTRWWNAWWFKSDPAFKWICLIWLQPTSFIITERTPVTSSSALLALCARHDKTGRLRVKDKEPSLCAGKESDKWHEMLATRRISEAVMTMPANNSTDPPKVCNASHTMFLLLA